MALIIPKPTTLFLLVLLTTTATLQPRTHSLSLSSLKTLLSLSHSLLIRVANLRAERGDISGSNRVKSIADKIGGRCLGLGFWWSVGWDYVKNRGWRDLDYGELRGVVLDANELVRVLGELTRAESEVERASWIGRNYRNVLEVSKRLFNRLLNVRSQSGALRQVVEILQVEVVEGGLLKDCLEVGGNDMKGLLQILKDMASQFNSSPDNDNWRSDL